MVSLEHAPFTTTTTTRRRDHIDGGEVKIVRSRVSLTLATAAMLIVRALAYGLESLELIRRADTFHWRTCEHRPRRRHFAPLFTPPQLAQPSDHLTFLTSSHRNQPIYCESMGPSGTSSMFPLVKVVRVCVSGRTMFSFFALFGEKCSVVLDCLNGLVWRERRSVTVVIGQGVMVTVLPLLPS